MGRSESLQDVRRRAQGIDGVNSTLRSLVGRSQYSYRREWKRWILICMGTCVEPWLDWGIYAWGGVVPESILRRRRVLGAGPKSIRSKLPGVRLLHIMAGYGDFPTAGVRCEQLLNAIGR